MHDALLNLLVIVICMSYRTLGFYVSLNNVCVFLNTLYKPSDKLALVCCLLELLETHAVDEALML